MRQALRLARRAYGRVSPNPLVGAVLVRAGRLAGQGWHHQAGQPHAEIEALRDAAARGLSPRGATLYVTLEPCCTFGRTPPCTAAILAAGARRVVVGAVDPNPNHAGRGLEVLRQAGVEVAAGVLGDQAAAMNEAFNHWIVRRTPWVTLKAAMTLDGKIATASGESRWITGDKSRAAGMRLRLGSDAILAGVETILADDPALTVRSASGQPLKPLRRVVLDSRARTPLKARVLQDAAGPQTLVVVTDAAPARRVEALARRAEVWTLTGPDGRVDLSALMERLGAGQITSLLVEGGGEVNGAFLKAGLAHRVAFFYAPKILCGRDARRGVAGAGFASVEEAPRLEDPRWRRLGEDLMLTARIARPA